jgi:capsular polysaccharide biosynthesis protein
MILLASLVLGLLLACGLALLLNLFDDRVRDAEELAESVGIPWLGSVKGAAAAGD